MLDPHLSTLCAKSKLPVSPLWRVCLAIEPHFHPRQMKSLVTRQAPQGVVLSLEELPAMDYNEAYIISLECEGT